MHRKGNLEGKKSNQQICYNIKLALHRKNYQHEGIKHNKSVRNDFLFPLIKKLSCGKIMYPI